MNADAVTLQSLHEACDQENWAGAAEILSLHARRVHVAAATEPRDRSVLAQLHADHIALERALLDRREQVMAAMAHLRRANSVAHAYLKR